MYNHQWDQLREADPDHSRRYAQRWRDLAAQGHDLDGEARTVSALVPPGSTVLDAGCGTGRVGGYLARRGYRVVGVDLDAELIAEARQEFPESEWIVSDLAHLDASTFAPSKLDSAFHSGFDAIVSAGNVLTFLDPRSRGEVLRRLGNLLGTQGRLITGFGAGRGYSFSDYDSDLLNAGLHSDARFSTWNLHPFTTESDFLVCLSSRTGYTQDVRGEE